MNDRDGAPGPQLPDFAGGGHRDGAPQLPDFAGGGHDGGRGRGPDEGRRRGQRGGQGLDGHSPVGHGPTGTERPTGRDSRGVMLAVLLGGAGFLVVVIAVVALVLSQTLFAGGPEVPTAGGGTTAAEPEDPKTPEESRSPEYVPTEEQTDEAGDSEITFAEQPTVACTIHDNAVETEQVEGAVRGGGLEFPHLEAWEVGADWSGSSAYTTDQSSAYQPVESGWYTVASVGAIDYPEEEGGYPGAQETARALFQCGLSRDELKEIYDDPAELKDYREEQTTVDGHPAWIVSADVQLSDLALFHTTEAWRLTVIVVDTPDGPAAFDGGAALGHDQQVADLETMIESLQVL